MRFTQLHIGCVLIFLIGSLAALTALADDVRAGSITLTASPTSISIHPGEKIASYTIAIGRVNNTEKVTLSVLGLPANTTASFAPNSTAGNSSVLSVQTQTTTPVGTYTLTIKGSTATTIATGTTVKLILTPPPTMSLSISPAVQSVIGASTVTGSLWINRGTVTGSIALTAENVPSGWSVQFNPQTTTGSFANFTITTNAQPFSSVSRTITFRATSGANYGTGTIVINANPGISWGAQFGTPEVPAFFPDFASDLTFDTAGNVYVVGHTITNAASGETDSWVAKFDANGNRIWLRTMTAMTLDRPTDVFVSSNGNVFVSGTCQRQNFGLDIFAARFDPNGNQFGNVQMLGTNLEDGSGGMQFGVTANGSITLTAPTRVIRSALVHDAVGNEVFSAAYDVARYTFDSNFTPTAATLVSLVDGNPKDIAVGSDGSVYVLTEDRSRVSSSDNRVIVNSRVQKMLSPTSQNYLGPVIGPTTASSTLFFATRLKADQNGNVVAVGNEYDRSVQVSQQVAPIRSWIVKLNSAGIVDWQDAIVSYHPTEIGSVDIDSSGNVYFAGNTWDSLAGVNPDAGIPGSPAARTDGWFAQYSSGGTRLYLSQFNVSDKDGFNVIKVGPTVSGLTPLYFAGYTVSMKAVNFGYEDALALRCFTIYCGQ